MAEPYTDAELEATMIIAQHGRTRIEGCACGWGMDGSKLGQSHALHVWRELQRTVLHGHDAQVRADERAQVAEEIAVYFDRWGAHAQGAIVHAWREAARLARQHATPPTTEGDHHAE